MSKYIFSIIIRHVSGFRELSGDKNINKIPTSTLFQFFDTQRHSEFEWGVIGINKKCQMFLMFKK